MNAEVTVYDGCSKAQLLMPCCKDMEDELKTLSEGSRSGKILPLGINILAGTHGLGKSYTAHLYAYALKGKKKFVIKIDSENMAKVYSTFSKGLLALKRFTDEISSYYSDSAFVLLLDEFDGYILKNQSSLYRKDIGDCLENEFKNSQNIQVIFVMNNSCIMKKEYWDGSKNKQELMQNDKDLQSAADLLHKLLESSKRGSTEKEEMVKKTLLNEGQLSKLMSLCTKYDFNH